MTVIKDKIDSLIKKAKIGDRGFYSKINGREFCVAKKWKNSVGEYKNFIYLVSVDYLNDLDKALREEKGVMVNAEWISKEYDIDKLIVQKENMNFNKIHIYKMLDCIHKRGRILDGLAYLFSVCKDDFELNRYISATINYEKNNNSLNTPKYYAMQIITRNKFENKYKDLLGEYNIFTVEKDLLKLEEKEIQKYPELKYDPYNQNFELLVNKEQIDDFFVTYRIYPDDILTSIEKQLSSKYGLPVTVGDEHIEIIKNKMGSLGLSIYIKFYDWYSENSEYEIYDYIEPFCSGNIDRIKQILDEVMTVTYNNKEISKEEKGGIIIQAQEFKEQLIEIQRLRGKEEEINV